MIQSLFSLLKSDQDSIGRKAAAYSLFGVDLSLNEPENIISKQLEIIKTDPHPHWRMAASRTLEMIAIGNLGKQALDSQSQIDEINSQLVTASNSSEEHIKFAATLIINEIKK